MNLLAVLIICWSIQVVSVLAHATHWPVLMLFWSWFGFVALATMGCALLRDRVKPSAQLNTYAAAEMIITFLIVSAEFKLIIYDNSPQLALRAWYVLMGLAVLVKIVKIGGRIIACPPLSDFLAIAFIVLLIYVPDVPSLVALSFIGEQWHHLDFFVMSPGVGIAHGLKPYVDVMSQYGVGIPITLTKLSQALGSFDYVPMLSLIIALVMIYYVMAYVFVRWWLGSAWLALAAVVVAIRVNLMHFGVSPLVWIYPSASPLRSYWDILFFIAMLAYVRYTKTWMLMTAAFLSGVAVWWMTSTGLVLAVTLATALLLLALRRQITVMTALLAGAVCAATAFALFFLSVGESVLSSTFWSNMISYMQHFAKGHGGGMLPMYESFKYRYWWSGFMAFAIPLSYLLTALWVGVLWWLRKIESKHILVILLCVYGLGQYSYFIVRSAQTSYYVVALPWVWVMCFWIHAVWQKHTNITMALAAVALYALFTNHNFISYPNALNWSKNPLVDPLVIQRFPDRQGYFNHQVKAIKEADKLPVNSLGNQEEMILTEDNFSSTAQLKEFYRRESDFMQDAQLIRRLVGQGQKVALLGSFETALLMQANRAPFFYHIPLVSSQPMRLRYIPADASHSPTFLQDTLNQMEQGKPEYIFVERVMLTDPLPEAVRKNNPSITAILDYIKQHYTPAQQGQYLVALKRT